MMIRGRPTIALLASAILIVGAVTVARGLDVKGPDSKGPDAKASSLVRATTEPITPIPPPPALDGKAQIGEMLFHDPRLSHDNRQSCASCHDLASNGADDRSKDLSTDGTPLHFNTPTVFNATLSFRQNWTGAFRTQQEQNDALLHNPEVMATSWPEILGKLRSDPAISHRFVEVFGHPPDAASVSAALVAFERTLVTPDSRFDRWLRGDAAAIDARELQGYLDFKSAGCISCHQGVNVGANLYERAGIFQPLVRGKTPLMRVASLRNVAVTAPYFDDGSVATLDQAVRRMAQAQLGRQLDETEVEDIVAFLKTLTGRYRGHLLSEHP